MELNEKIAARRKELEQQAIEEKLAAIARAKESQIEYEEKMKLEMPKRLAEIKTDDSIRKLLKKVSLDCMRIDDYWIPIFYLILSVQFAILLVVMTAPIWVWFMVGLKGLTDSFLWIWLFIGPIMIWRAVVTFSARISWCQSNIINECKLHIETEKEETLNYLKKIADGSSKPNIENLRFSLPLLTKVMTATCLICMMVFIWLASENNEIAVLFKKADAGDIALQERVANWSFQNGNYALGMEWLQRSAIGGYEQAQLILGDGYETGYLRGGGYFGYVFKTNVDLDKASVWY
jgi:hypothetical protein